jgi:hypothetical protein
VVSAWEPSVSVLVKLGSIARHLEEMTGPGGHHFDVAAVTSLLADPEVKAWMAEADALALLPVSRTAQTTDTEEI